MITRRRQTKCMIALAGSPPSNYGSPFTPTHVLRKLPEREKHHTGKEKDDVEEKEDAEEQERESCGSSSSHA